MGFHITIVTNSINPFKTWTAVLSLAELHRETDSKKKEGNVLFNDTLNTFYLQLYSIDLKEKDHECSQRENLLMLLF